MNKLTAVLAAVVSVAVAQTVRAGTALSYSDGAVHEYDATTDESTVDSLAVSAASQFDLKKGELNVTASSAAIQASGGSVVKVEKDARLIAKTDATAAQSVLFKGGSKLTIDGGYVRAPCLLWSARNVAGGAYFDSGILEIMNGGTFIIDKTGSDPTYGMAALGIDNASRVVVDNGSTLSLVNDNNAVFALKTGGTGCSISVTNSTVNYYKWNMGGSGSAQGFSQNGCVNLHNAKLNNSVANRTASLTIFGDKYETKNNLIRITGADSYVQMSIETGCASVTPAGNAKNNTIELHEGVLDCTPGATIGLSLVNGSGNRFLQFGGKMMPTVYYLGGTANAFEISGGTFGVGEAKANSILTFNANAKDCAVTLKGQSASMNLQAYGPGQALAFTEGASGCKFTVDDSTLTVKGEQDFGKNCPNCVITLKGTAPRINITDWSAPKAFSCKFGDASSDLDGKTVALRFVLPAEPYAAVPVFANSNKPLKFCPNAKIVVDVGDWVIGTDKKKTFYPLVQDSKMGFSGEMTEELVTALNANATLPEGAALEYDATSKTLGVRMPRKKLGLLLVVQ